MSLSNKKKAWRISINIYVYCTYFQSARYMDRIIVFIKRIVAKKKLVRVSYGLTDKLW